MGEDRWSCPNCREIIEGQFDSCWQCGCSRDGSLNLEFLREPSPSGDPSALETAFADAFVCAKCDGREARVERVGTRGTGFAKLSAKDFLALSCQDCGYTEFYNLSVLEGRTDLQNLLRGLFG